MKVITLGKILAWIFLLGQSFCAPLPKIISDFERAFPIESMAEDVIIFPPVNQNGKETLLVCIPGMDVPYEEYVVPCRAIQSATPFKLWLAVMSFSGNTVTPIAIQKGFDIAIEKVKSSGFFNITNSDVFSWGHSAGGVFATNTVATRRYGGHIMFGSYLFGITLRDFPVPALTVGGDLDGLTQVTKIAEEYKYTQEFIDQGKLEEAISRKPVIVLEGMNHAQMCNNYVQGLIARDDFTPEITLEEAVSLISQVTSAFLRVHRAEGTNGEAFKYLEQKVNHTKSIVGGFIQAQLDDFSYWCERTQRIVANIYNDALLEITNRYEDNLDDFADSKASLTISNGKAYITTHSYLNYEEPEQGIMVAGSYPYEAACKCKSQESILDKLGNVEHGKDGSCRDEHLELMDWALRSVSEKARSRYLLKGKQLNFLADVDYPRGDQWLSSHLVFDTAQNPVDVAASRLFSSNIPTEFGGATYCKSLPASKAIAWILHDSLPRGL